MCAFARNCVYFKNLLWDTLHEVRESIVHKPPCYVKLPPRSEMCLLTLVLATLETCNDTTSSDCEARATDNKKMAARENMKVGVDEECT